MAAGTALASTWATLRGAPEAHHGEHPGGGYDDPSALRAWWPTGTKEVHTGNLPAGIGGHGHGKERVTPLLLIHGCSNSYGGDGGGRSRRGLSASGCSNFYGALVTVYSHWVHPQDAGDLPLGETLRR